MNCPKPACCPTALGLLSLAVHWQMGQYRKIHWEYSKSLSPSVADELNVRMYPHKLTVNNVCQRDLNSSITSFQSLCFKGIRTRNTSGINRSQHPSNKQFNARRFISLLANWLLRSFIIIAEQLKVYWKLASWSRQWMTAGLESSANKSLSNVLNEHVKILLQYEWLGWAKCTISEWLFISQNSPKESCSKQWFQYSTGVLLTIKIQNSFHVNAQALLVVGAQSLKGFSPGCHYSTLQAGGSLGLEAEENSRMCLPCLFWDGSIFRWTACRLAEQAVCLFLFGAVKWYSLSGQGGLQQAADDRIQVWEFRD